LSLEKNDNDLARFLTYIVAALQTIEAGIGEIVLTATQAPKMPPVETVLTDLINSIAGITYDFVLILDDYHAIESQEIHTAIAFLIGHLPLTMHIIITSRSDPQLPLARYRADRIMTELRTDDLRFSTQEAGSYLNQVMALTLDSRDVIALNTRTEGWISGLHLAALSLRGKEDAAEFISVFTGDDRYVADYLINEVLEQRPEGTQEFLLQTSILNRMNGPLCDSITGLKGGQIVLEKLEQANLFITPLDNQRHWYRYHHLFAELLRHRLEMTSGDHEIKILHQRASQWYEENNYLVDAVDHALKAGDHENVVRLINENGSEMLSRGQANTLLGWQSEVPKEILETRPKVCMAIAWAEVATGNREEAERYLQLIEHALGVEMEVLLSDIERLEDMDDFTQAALMEIAVMRAELAIENGDIDRASLLCNLVLSRLDGGEEILFYSPPKELLMVVHYILGLVHILTGQLHLAHEELSRASFLGESRGNVHIVSGAYGRLATVLVALGQLRQAEQSCQKGLKIVQGLGGKESPISGLLKAELGNLLYEQNDLKNAQKHIQEAIAMAKPWGLLEAFVPGYTGLAMIRNAQGDLAGAYNALDELAEHGKSNPQMVMPAVESVRAIFQVQNGQLKKAIQWAQDNDLSSDREVSILHIDDYMIFARVLIAQGELDQAAGLLSRMLAVAEKAEWMGKVIEVLVLQAMVLHATDKGNSALSSLEQALILAAPEGYVRTFVDEGEQMAHLLRRAKSRGVATEYVITLLGEFESATYETQSTPSHASGDQLSERELEVLRLLHTDLSGPEIANELTIALTTMRFHTRNIYHKLDVHSRIEAIHKAEELRLI
jgi:LuxR family maltose regulon positive regulatory protein